MLENAGQLTTVRGAEREEEIGGIVDIYQRTPGSTAVLFDDIPGYQHGYRVLANILTSVRRINMTLGLPDGATEMDLVRYWRNYMKEADAALRSGLQKLAARDRVRKEKYAASQSARLAPDFRILTGPLLPPEPDQGPVLAHG